MLTRLIVEYTAGDDCTYYCTNTVPVEYESAEAFIVDIEVAARMALLSQQGNFTLAGKKFDTSSFFYDCNWAVPGSGIFDAPSIMTIDEWFTKK